VQNLNSMHWAQECALNEFSLHLYLNKCVCAGLPSGSVPATELGRLEAQEQAPDQDNGFERPAAGAAYLEARGELLPYMRLVYNI
jgi:hypothetical protein